MAQRKLSYLAKEPDWTVPVGTDRSGKAKADAEVMNASLLYAIWLELRQLNTLLARRRPAKARR